MSASMGPICPHRPSRLSLILHSVVRVLLFRKRPSETNSGPGLETPTDAVTVVRLQLSSYPLSSSTARGPARASFATSTFRLALHKGSCVIPLSPRFPSLACQPSFFRHSETKARLPQTTTVAKEHRTYACQRHKELLGRAIAAKKDNPFSASSRQSTPQRQRAVSMSLAPGRAGVHATRRARQTTGRNVSNESTSLQDMQQGSKGRSKLHWPI